MHEIHPSTFISVIACAHDALMGMRGSQRTCFITDVHKDIVQCAKEQTTQHHKEIASCMTLDYLPYPIFKHEGAQ